MRHRLRISDVHIPVFSDNAWSIVNLRVLYEDYYAGRQHSKLYSQYTHVQFRVQNTQHGLMWDETQQELTSRDCMNTQYGQTYSRLIASLKVTHFNKHSLCFSTQQTPVLFPQSTILVLRQSQRLLNGSLYWHSYMRLTTLSFFVVNHTYNVTFEQAFLWSTVIKHDCVDLCRACGT